MHLQCSEIYIHLVNIFSILRGPQNNTAALGKILRQCFVFF